MSLALALLSALLALYGVFEIGQALAARRPSPSRLEGPVLEGQQELLQEPQAPFWVALLGVVFPRLFDREQLFQRHNIVDLIRRSGYYPYASPGEFYAALLSSTATGILVSGLVAGLMTLAGAAPIGLIGAALILQGFYNRPMARIQRAIREREALMRQNMLLGLSQLAVSLEAGMGVQEALRAAGNLGGPFCNLLTFIAARLQVEPAEDALKRAWAHVPNPQDTNLVLFFNDLEGFFLRQQPLARSIKALTDAVRQEMLNETAARASRVKQRITLYGIFAVLGLLASALLPAFLG